jgi:hypothetical protein
MVVEIILALIATAGAILAAVIPLHLKNMHENRAAANNQQAQNVKVDIILDELKTSISQLEGLIEERAGVNDTQYTFSTTAIVGLIRDRISQAHAHFTAKGSIDKYTKASIDSLYETYKGTEQNSFVRDLINEIDKLPIKG